MQAAKESPDDKAAREKERAMAEQERNTASQELAGDMTGDLRRRYGPRFSMFSQ